MQALDPNTNREGLHVYFLAEWVIFSFEGMEFMTVHWPRPRV